MKRPETMLEIRKYTFLNVINKPNVYKFLKDFTKTKKIYKVTQASSQQIRFSINL